MGKPVCLPLYLKAVLNLISFVVYLFCSLSLCSFWAQKERKTPGTRVEQVTQGSCSYHSIDNTALSHPVRHNLWLCYSRLTAGGIVDLQANSGTKELASRTPIIVWHTRSDTFVLIPLLELTRAVAQTVPVLF